MKRARSAVSATSPFGVGKSAASGAETKRPTSCARRSATGSGVPGGARSASQRSPASSMPCSRKVGTSAAAGKRAWGAMPRIFNRPPRDRATPTGSIIESTWSASGAATAGPAPW